MSIAVDSIAQFRMRKYNIPKCYLSTVSFEALQIKRQYLNALEEMGLSNPTEIQEKAIPCIRAGQDVLGIAQTGTGKTAAYALPLLDVLKYAQGTSPRCLVLVPTKELVLQVSEYFKKLAKYTDLRIGALYGGVGPKTQIEHLGAGLDLVVATPGRFLEVYSRGAFETKKLKHLVLDEADRMMDMGFMPQLRQILEVIPAKRQNVLLSATFPDHVHRLSEEFLLWPTRIEITPQSTPVETVDQVWFTVPNFQTKLNLLMHLLENEDLKRVIIFVRTRELAENIARFLVRKEVGELRVLHANKGQNSRLNAVDDFRAGDIRILVSTDVSARGIDIPAVSHVINFSVPRDHLDYVHRIGRTGRAFLTGTAITFVDAAEVYHIKKIEHIIRMSVQQIDLPKGVTIESTTKEEKQEQAKEIDFQKRRENPEYKGAFHKKKVKPGSKPQQSGPRKMKPTSGRSRG
jgi:ATP-dependent RNA helicase RhlE